MRYLLKDDRHAGLQARTIQAATDTRFQNCLSPQAWNALPAAVQNRFASKVAPGEARVYRFRKFCTALNVLPVRPDWKNISAQASA